MMRLIFVLLIASVYLGATAPSSFSQVLDEFDLPVLGQRPGVLAPGSEGTMWYTVQNISKVGRITTDGDITEFDIPGPLTSLTRGPDDNIWGGISGGILRIRPDGTATLFSSPFNAGLTTSASTERIIDVASGPDGNLWAISSSNNNALHAVSKITPDGEFTVYNILQQFGTPNVIAAGPDGKMWFLTNSITRYGTITTEGDITIATLPSDLSFEGLLSTVGMIAGPDGNMWLTDEDKRVVLRLTPEGRGSRFKLPSLDAKPQKITVGPHGDLWVALSQPNKVARITTAGVITEFELPEGVSSYGIALGSDNNIWIAHTLSGSKISVFTPPDPGVRVGAVQSSTQIADQSYVRLYNNGTDSSTASITLHNSDTGESLGVWTSPPIGANQAKQYTIQTLEGSVLGTGVSTTPDLYTLSIDRGFNGLFQHIRWNASSETLTNLSTCATGSTALPQELQFVHSGLLDDGYPSRIIAHNTGRTASTVSLGIYDARYGNLLATFQSESIPSNGQAIISISQIEDQTNLVPVAGQFHYVVKVENAFSGFLQHLVSNTAAEALTDMTASCAVGTISAQSAAHISEFSMPDGETNPGKILSGPGGDLLVLMTGGDIASVSLDGQFNMSALPTTDLISNGIVPPYEIEVGPNNEVWYSTSSRMGRINASGTFDSFDLPNTFVATQALMTPSSQGDMWFARFFTGEISRANQSGEISSFTIPGFENASNALLTQTGIIAMATGTDNQAYFPLVRQNQIGRINNAGVIQRFDIPESYTVPRSIEAGPQNSTMWFTTQNPAALGRFEADDTITMFPLSNLNAAPGNLAQGPDGNMWFTLNNTNEIGRITPDGVITTYPIPTAQGGVSGITLGDDGNIWFTEPTARKVGRITPTLNGIISSGVYSSAQQTSLSYLRFYNSAATAQPLTLTLSDFDTGETLGTWTSPSIAGNSALQVSVSSIENEMGLTAPFANRYSVTMSYGFTGSYQHVVWRASTGTLTNLTSCSETRSNTYDQVGYVHTSNVGPGYPSAVVMLNDSAFTNTVSLGFYDSRDGALLATTAPLTIPPYGQRALSVSALEEQLNLQPDPELFHYILKAESPSAVTLQHLVNNTQVGITTDITSVCPLH